MKFIPTLEITSKMMGLIEEAKKELIIVSPYVNIQKWGKMKSCIERAIERGVAITIIARKNAEQDLSYFNNSKVKLVLVMDLHAKVYINDNYGIVTSQNLLQYSDNNSIEIGYITTNKTERKELIDFVNQFIFKFQPVVELEIFKGITLKDYELPVDLAQFKDWQVSKTFEVFNKSFHKVLFKSTSSYVFSSNLLPFADVMIYNRLVIKYSKMLPDSEDFASQLAKLEYRFVNDFEIQYLATHKTNFYFEFVPKGNFTFKSLLEDYVMIINEILKSTLGVTVRKRI